MLSTQCNSCRHLDAEKEVFSSRKLLLHHNAVKRVENEEEEEVCIFSK